MGREHCGKRRNCSLRATSPFSSVFKRLVLQTRKNHGLFGKGLRQSDDNFKFDENGGKCSEKVEKAVGKGEIARYKQFLLFYSVFKRPVQQTRENKSLYRKGLRSLFIRHH